MKNTHASFNNIFSSAFHLQDERWLNAFQCLKFSHFSFNFSWSLGIFYGATFILAIHPILWLIQTWADPSYDSIGIWIFILVVGLIVWSGSSPVQRDNNSNNVQHHSQWAFGLLCGTSLLRLASQLWAINIIGAMALVLDLFSIALLCDFSRRQRALSPFWLSTLFIFCLPVFQILQRVLGYGLQQISAQCAAGILNLWFHPVYTEGVRLLIEGHEVLVDFPCSGATSVSMLLLLYAFLMCVKPFRLTRSLLGLLGVGFFALMTNTVRISILAVSATHPSWFMGAHLMDAPWHEGIGLVSILLFGFVPVMWMSHLLCVVNTKEYHAMSGWEKENFNHENFNLDASQDSESQQNGAALERAILQKRKMSQYLVQKRLNKALEHSKSDTSLSDLPQGKSSCNGKTSLRGFKFFNRQGVLNTLPRFWKLSGSLLFLTLSLWIVQLPHHPLDTSRKLASVSLPKLLNGVAQQPIPLSPKESDYFVKFGGQAVKGNYGENTLLIVKTSSPLRHLHHPADCLKGLGFHVTYLGVNDDSIPSANYVASAPNGKQWRVVVSFVSNTGDYKTSVSEVIWDWFQHPQKDWTEIQRISPLDNSSDEQIHWEKSVISSLHLPPPKVSHSQSTV
ncbi:MAG: exosortase T [Cyanobacteria bacterium]|nr:exosortase T [Cyanobacteriota bacterium]